MPFSQREAPPAIAALDAYTLQWMEEWNKIKSQYEDQENSELSTFQQHTMGKGNDMKCSSSGVAQKIRPRPKERYEDSRRGRRSEHVLAFSQRHARRMTRKRSKLDSLDRDASLSARVNQRQHKPSDCIIDPTVGNVYRAYWKPSETWYAAVVLPTGDFDSVEMLGSLVDTGLLKYIPVCYCYDKQTRKITGWQKGYETGGSHAIKRKFPVMYFDDALTIPLEGDFRFPQRDLFDWVPAKSLKPFDFKDPESSQVPGYKSACDFRARIEARRKQQAQLGSLVIDGGDRTRDGKSTELTSSSSNNSPHIQQPNTENIFRGTARSASAEPTAPEEVTAASMDSEMVDIYIIPSDDDEPQPGSETPCLGVKDSSMSAKDRRIGVVQSIGSRGSDRAVDANSCTARGACPDTAGAEVLERTQPAPEPVQGFSTSARTSQTSTASEAGLIERQPMLRTADGPRSSSESQSNEDGDGHYSNTCDDVRPQGGTAPSDSSSGIRY
ncbi:hypothetical protein DL771_009493 [Monosporascus sp. 5C6A]|nr:hypothetical protein DL771_009493 [Monosporascus sp. 5C6A]